MEKVEQLCSMVLEEVLGIAQCDDPVIQRIMSDPERTTRFLFVLDQIHTNLKFHSTVSMR